MRGKMSYRCAASDKPNNSMLPAVGVRTPSSMEMVVVLPAPLPPSSPTVSPGATENVIPRTASTVPYDFFKSRTTMAGGRGSLTVSIGQHGTPLSDV